MKEENNKQELGAMIDWVQVTFKQLNHHEVMDYILQFDRDMMTYENRGRFRYTGKWCFGGIELLTPPEDYPEMGYHLYLTGSACRSLEIYLRAQKRDWYSFFANCLEYGGRFTRLDIAIDDRNTYLDIREFNQKIKDGECVSKFRNRVLLDSGTTTGKDTGCTVNLGSEESSCCMVFYEKNYEQSKKTGLPLESFGAWNRYEVRVKHEAATNCVRELVKRRNICFIGLEIINYYIRVLVRNPNDANRSRWQTWEPWKQFVDGMDKLKLTMQPAPRTLEQKKQWIADYVAPTLKMIQIADDNLGEDFLKSVLDDITLKKRQKQIVDDYLVSRHEMQEEEENEKKLLQDAVEKEVSSLPI